MASNPVPYRSGVGQAQWRDGGVDVNAVVVTWDGLKDIGRRAGESERQPPAGRPTDVRVRSPLTPRCNERVRTASGRRGAFYF